jgi:hypothetical protein
MPRAQPLDRPSTQRDLAGRERPSVPCLMSKTQVSNVHSGLRKLYTVKSACQRGSACFRRECPKNLPRRGLGSRRAWDVKFAPAQSCGKSERPTEHVRAACLPNAILKRIMTRMGYSHLASPVTSPSSSASTLLSGRHCRTQARRTRMILPRL